MQIRIIFFHGFLTSVMNGVWIGIIHAAFYPIYIQNNPGMLDMYAKFPQSIPPQVLILIMGPVIGVLTGLIAGLFAWAAAKLKKKKPNVVQP